LVDSQPTTSDTVVDITPSSLETPTVDVNTTSDSNTTIADLTIDTNTVDPISTSEIPQAKMAQPLNVSLSATLLANQTDLSMSITSPVTTGAVGDIVTFTIQYANS
jgi:hypothetical protein